MSSINADSSPNSNGAAPASGKTWTVGTLTYTQQGLFIVFFWLMWNDFSITMLEGIQGLNGLLMYDQGANLTQMATLGLMGFFLPWLNPWVSTWSDRHRGPWGRRRPFLFFATPFFAFFLGSYPYMPTIYHHVQGNPWVALIVRHLPEHISGQVFFMAVSGLLAGIFNAVVLAIFSYLYWDVVPEAVLGRFQSLSKIAALLAGIVWNLWILGQGEKHSKTVYSMTALFCLVVYLISVWQIKEGEYPPPDAHKKGGGLAPIRAYFVECFSESYYLWIFVGMLFCQLGNQGGGAQGFYLLKDIHVPLGDIGWANGVSSSIVTGCGMIFGFYIGMLTDKFKPVRLVPPIWAATSLVCFGMYFLVHGAVSLLIFSVLRGLLNFCLGVAFGAFQVEVFPREKIGQFCSAQAVFYQVIIMVCSVPIASFFDFCHRYFVNGYEIGYLWTAMFYGLAAICYFKVYVNWQQRKGQTPVPHAG